MTETGKCRFKRDAEEAVLNIVDEFPDDCLLDKSNCVSLTDMFYERGLVYFN